MYETQTVGEKFTICAVGNIFFKNKQKKVNDSVRKKQATILRKIKDKENKQIRTTQHSATKKESATKSLEQGVKSS